jgi:hypothetical protein
MAPVSWALSRQAIGTTGFFLTSGVAPMITSRCCAASSSDARV